MAQFAKRLAGITGNAIRDIFKLLQNPQIISFAGGMPAPSSFPVEDIQKIAVEVLETSGINILQYGATEGYDPLKTQAVKWLSKRGISCGTEDVLVISGGQQGIDLLCKAFVDPGDVVLVERPTYLAALQIIASYEGRAVSVGTDEQGIDLNELEDKIKALHPKLIYLVPTFQNPTGKTLSLPRRQGVAALAEKYGVPVVEDDPYRDLRYRGEALPALKAFDKAGQVIYLGSFSKIISPGLRVGVAVASKDILRKMVVGKQATDVHTASLSQAIVARFLEKGLLDPHIEKICATYKVQFEAMLTMLQKTMPPNVSYTRPDGGLFIWAELPRHIDTLTLLQKAVTKNVAFIPGTHFYAEGGNHHTLRLNFSNASVEKISQGITALSDVIRSEGA